MVRGSFSHGLNGFNGWGCIQGLFIAPPSVESVQSVAKTSSLSSDLFPRVVFLDRTYVQTFAPERADAVDGRGCACNGRNAGHTVVDGRAANRLFVEKGF